MLHTQLLGITHGTNGGWAHIMTPVNFVSHKV